MDHNTTEDVLAEFAVRIRRRWGAIHLEVSLGSEPFASICGQRLSNHEPLTVEQGLSFIRAIKVAVGLSLEEPPIAQSGRLKLGGGQYDVDCCPQFRGEILVLR